MPAPARRPRADVDRAAAHLSASDGLFTVQRHLAAAAGASRLTTAARWTRELHTGPVMLSTGIQQPALAVVRPTVSSHDVQLPMHHDHDDDDDHDDVDDDNDDDNVDDDDDDDESTSSCEQQQQQTTAL